MFIRVVPAVVYQDNLAVFWLQVVLCNNTSNTKNLHFLLGNELVHKLLTLDNFVISPWKHYKACLAIKLGIVNDLSVIVQ